MCSFWHFLTIFVSFSGFRKVKSQSEKWIIWKAKNLVFESFDLVAHSGIFWRFLFLFQVLEKLKANQRRDYLKGTVSGSVQATDRLMKELRDIYRSPSFKSGAYQVINNFFSYQSTPNYLSRWLNYIVSE